ncbi:MAG: hypothetical protein ACJAZ9_000833 [Neolewinella sp.]|jgi:hypothetical protein
MSKFLLLIPVDGRDRRCEEWYKSKVRTGNAWGARQR